MAGRKNLATRMAGREEIIILAGKRFGEDGGKVFWRILSSGGKGMGERKVLRATRPQQQRHVITPTMIAAAAVVTPSNDIIIKRHIHPQQRQQQQQQHGNAI